VAAAAVVAAATVLVPGLAAQELSRPAPAWPEAIEDNSFLIEEAYNQDPGVVQLIFNLTRVRPGGDWLWSFTNEWPVPRVQHQLSFTVPYTFGHGQDPTDVGDILLNYRYQALSEETDGVAFAPRLTVSLPTGSERKGLGMGVTGYQLGLPFSKRVTAGLALHLNAGATWWPGFRSLGAGPPAVTTNVWTLNEGASAIWLVSPRVNLMLEAVASQTRSSADAGQSSWSHQAIVSPGLRYAFNLPSGQLVVGAAAPIGVTAGSPDPSVFLYLSWEMPVWTPSR
jgi:hypothetical protein